MDLFLSKVLSSLLEIVLFAALPFIYWLSKDRKNAHFLSWLGFKKVSKCDLIIFFQAYVLHLC